MNYSVGMKVYKRKRNTCHIESNFFIVERVTSQLQIVSKITPMHMLHTNVTILLILECKTTMNNKVTRWEFFQNTEFIYQSIYIVRSMANAGITRDTAVFKFRGMSSKQWVSFFDCILDLMVAMSRFLLRSL